MRRDVLISSSLCFVLACSASDLDRSNRESSSINQGQALDVGRIHGARPIGPTTLAAPVDAGTCAHTMRIATPPGLVIPSVALSHVYWGSYWSGAGAGERATYDQTWTDVGNNPAFYARLSEYSTATLTIQTGSWQNPTLANATLASGTTLDETQIQTEIQAELQAGVLPARTDSRLYVFMLPPGVTSLFDQQNGYVGHHASFRDPSGNVVYYAVITYNADPQYNNPLISHEIAEAITDPVIGAGWTDETGDEIGDVCRGQYTPIDTFQIEKTWSQKACACVGVASSTPPSTITNGDFETTDLTGWTSVGATSVGTSPHGGRYAAQVGSTRATTGDSSIAQTFTAPSDGGTLSFWYAVHCNDTISYDWATATLKDNTTGTTTKPLAKTCTNTAAWKQNTSALVGGHSYTLTLLNHDDGASGDPTYTLYDDVTVTTTAPPPPATLTNGDFESTVLTPWTSTGAASIATTPHGGRYSAELGLVGKATNGNSTIAQSFTASSTGGTLAFWVRVVCKDTVTYDWATATLKDTTTGVTTTPLAKTCTNTGTWKRVTATLTANHTYTLTLVNRDDNNAGDETYTLFDDVSVQ